MLKFYFNKIKIPKKICFSKDSIQNCQNEYILPLVQWVYRIIILVLCSSRCQTNKYVVFLNFKFKKWLINCKNSVKTPMCFDEH